MLSWDRTSIVAQALFNISVVLSLWTKGIRCRLFRTVARRWCRRIVGGRKFCSMSRNMRAGNFLISNAIANCKQRYEERVNRQPAD